MRFMSLYSDQLTNIRWKKYLKIKEDDKEMKNIKNFVLYLFISHIL